jgi:predicted nucleotidyltransferase
MITGINFKSSEFITLCKSHKVRELFAFGSVVNGNFTKDSDIDLVVDIDEKDPVNKGGLLLSLWDKFEKYFGRKVDLLTPDSIRNPYLKESIDDTKKLIYSSGSKEKVLF